jgi:hypothetical protein
MSALAKRVAIIALAFLSSCASRPELGSDPVTDAAVRAATHNYFDCVGRNAARLFPQPEPAQTIAIAAVAQCSREDIAASQAYSNEAGDAYASHMMRDLRDKAMAGAVAIVVSRRAERR